MTALPQQGILDQLDATVRQLHDEGREPTVDGRELGWDLPQGLVALSELRPLLLAPTTSYATRDRAVAWVADRARSGDEGWTLGLTWVLSPGLHRMRQRLVFAGADGAEAEAELLAGLLLVAHERRFDGRRGVAATLCWRAHDAAYRALGLDRGRGDRPLALDLLVTPPAIPAPGLQANPEAVLHAAVTRGVLTAADAEIVATTRMDDRTLAELAGETGLRTATLQKRRARAEARLAALLDPWISGVRPGSRGLGGRWTRARKANEATRGAPRTYRARPWARVPAAGGSLPSVAEGIAA